MMGISTPNAAYKIGSLVKKGYVEKIQSTTDRREYFLRPTQKYIDYYSISYSYLHTVIERVRKRFPAEDCDKMGADALGHQHRADAGAGYAGQVPPPRSS